MRGEKKVLLFGCGDPETVLRAAAAAHGCGAELSAVPRAGWALPLRDLAAGKTPPEGPAPAAAAVGPMVVLCGMEREVDTLLPALRSAGVTGPAAVLTETNGRWTPQHLYRELERERRRMQSRPPR